MPLLQEQSFYPKDSPGLVVTFTLILSESTFVPVTELLSPPASRITGALSPVMADSSMVASPSIISHPSESDLRLHKGKYLPISFLQTFSK
jgi:hypothetical protein